MNRQQYGVVSTTVQRSSVGEVVIAVTGDLTGAATLEVHRIITDELVTWPAQLALDLSGVTSIDTAGVDMLATVAAVAGESDISFCLVGGDPVATALADAELTELFEIVASVNEAC
ncbi:MAG: hypothetical protein JWR37_3702 [Mycobacterium sp.]|nr:hypothetical protein [Mycobacterium sp.]